MTWNYDEKLERYEKVLKNDDYGTLSSIICKFKGEYISFIYENSLLEDTKAFPTLEKAKEWSENL